MESEGSLDWTNLVGASGQNHLRAQNERADGPVLDEPEPSDQQRRAGRDGHVLTGVRSVEDRGPSRVSSGAL